MLVTTTTKSTDNTPKIDHEKKTCKKQLVRREFMPNPLSNSWFPSTTLPTPVSDLKIESEYNSALKECGNLEEPDFCFYTKQESTPEDNLKYENPLVSSKTDMSSTMDGISFFADGGTVNVDIIKEVDTSNDTMTRVCSEVGSESFQFTKPISETMESSNDTMKRNQSNVVYLCTDGGSRANDNSAIGWVLYNCHWNLIHAKGEPLKYGSNNDAELQAAFDGLQYTTSQKKNMRIVHITDSKLVEGGITGNSQLNAARHQSIRTTILDLQGRNGNYIFSYQVPREFNSGADRMCNLAMDAMETVYQFSILPSDILTDRITTQQHVMLNIYPSLMQYGEAAMMSHTYKFRTVMTELIFKSNYTYDSSYLTPGGIQRTKNVNGDDFVTGFETDVSPNIVDGIERVIPLEAILKIKEECDKHKIEWHNSAFSVAKYKDSSPSQDIELLSALCRAIGNDVAQVIRWYRNQTPEDNRPNNHLRPALYEEHLQSYPGLSALCEIARNGFKSRVESFQPPRPFTRNHQSAVERSPECGEN